LASKGKIYIAGPIKSRLEAGESHTDIRIDFDDAAEKMRLDGWEPVNPYELHPSMMPWEDCIRADIPGLIQCQAIYLLPGYQFSRGVMEVELPLARSLKMQILYAGKAEGIGQEATRIVTTDRGPQYGHPTKNFEDIANLWSAYKQVPFSTQDVAAMMILLKIARAKNGYRRDHLVDIAGYAETWELVEQAR